MDTEMLFDILQLLVAVMIVTILAAIVLTGCNAEDLKTTAYKSLRVSAVTYDATMKSAVGLYTDGHVTSDQMTTVVDAAHKYRLAYLSCVALLESYNAAIADNPDASELKLAVNTCTRSLSDLVELVTEFRCRHPTEP